MRKYHINSTICEDKNSIGYKIIEYRAKNNLYRKELSEILKCNIQTLEKWEKNKVIPNEKYQNKLKELIPDIIFYKK
jgi:DNA-binding transcriptional regulator YiaG